MMESVKNSKYYATTTECNTASSCNEKGEGEDTDTHYKDIFELAITNGDVDTKYSCTGTLKVKGSGGMITDNEDDLQPTDVTIGIKGYNTAGDSTTLDLVALKEAGNEQTYEIKYDITGNDTKKIQAYVMLENTGVEQNYLANKDLNIEITAESVKCDIVQPGPAA